MKNFYEEYYSGLLNKLDQSNLKRIVKVVEGPQSKTVLLHGKKITSFCSNDYLGLANNPKVKKSFINGIKKLGSGSGASHLISGHNLAHENLQEKLVLTQKDIFDNPSVLLFSSGYMANMALINSLAKIYDFSDEVSIYSEKLNHASLIDSVKLACTKNNIKKIIFSSNQIDNLNKKLSKDKSVIKIIVTDGVFSMDGNIAPLDQLLKIAEKHNALIVVDDAHGFGTIGKNGLGILDFFKKQLKNLDCNRILYMGTLGKSVGVSGAFVIASKYLIDWISQTGRTYIYTTAFPPGMCHAIMKSIDLILERKLQKKLVKNIKYFKNRIKISKWNLLPSVTPIQPMIVRSSIEAINAEKNLKKLGFWVPAIRPPTVPINLPRLRISLSAAHSLKNINELIKAIQYVEKL